MVYVVSEKYIIYEWHGTLSERRVLNKWLAWSVYTLSEGSIPTNDAIGQYSVPFVAEKYVDKRLAWSVCFSLPQRSMSTNDTFWSVWFSLPQRNISTNDSLGQCGFRCFIERWSDLMTLARCLLIKSTNGIIFWSPASTPVAVAASVFHFSCSHTGEGRFSVLLIKFIHCRCSPSFATVLDLIDPLFLILIK